MTRGAGFLPDSFGKPLDRGKYRSSLYELLERLAIHGKGTGRQRLAETHDLFGSSRRSGGRWRSRCIASVRRCDRQHLAEVDPTADGTPLIPIQDLVVDEAPVAVTGLLLAAYADHIGIVEDIDVSGVATRFLADIEAVGLDFVETALGLLGERGLGIR